MKILKRVICVFMSVLILFFTVNNSFFSLHKMDYVEAASSGTNELTYKMMYYICFYVGSVAWSYFCTGETPDVSKDDIAEFGHKVIQEAVAPPYDGELLLDDEPVVGMVAPSRQPYVYGRKSLNDIANTLWVVIMNDVNDPDDDDDDDDDKEEQPTSNPEEKPTTETDPKIKEQVKLDFTVSADNVTSTFWMMSALGANVIAQGLSRLYDKYLDPDIVDDPVTEMMDKLNETNFTGYEDFYIQDVNMYKINIYYFSNVKSSIYNNIYTADTMVSQRLHLEGTFNNGFWLKNDIGDAVSAPFKRVVYATDGSYYNTESTSLKFFNIYPNTYNAILASNLPMFESYGDWKTAMESGDYTGALNYARSYQIADWLQDDWSGELVDPLTGLNAAGDWFYLARHEGLNKAFGNGVNVGAGIAQNYLRDYFGNLKEDKGLDYDPITNPLPDPICYPADMPEPVIDPDASVALTPGVRPGTNPGTNPSTDPDPSPSTNPSPTPSPGEGIDSTKPIVDLSKFFPFCIPFDLIHLIQALDADPVAPKWTLKLEPPQFPVEWEVVIDLSEFETLAKIFRTGETLLFVVGLILITRGIIKG